MSDLIRNILGYPTSRDYARLWELAQTQSVVCAVDYDTDCRDIAHTICRQYANCIVVSVSARGICYLEGDSRDGIEKFVTRCERANLEWIVPDAEMQSQCHELRNQLEREQVRLAACGVVALANTRESAQTSRDGIHPDFLSGSLHDVSGAVDREMDLREQCDELLAALEMIDRACRRPLYEENEELTLASLSVRRGIRLTEIRGYASNAIDKVKGSAKEGGAA